MGSRRLRLPALAALAAACFACAPAPAAAEPAAGDRETAEQALEAATEAFDGRGLKTGRELTLSLAELSRNYRALPRGERSEARELLARPTQGLADPQQGGWTAPLADQRKHCTTNFCVHWVVSTDDAPDLTDTSPANGIPDYVEISAAEFEYIRQVHLVDLGWALPKSDGTTGGDARTDVYISDLQPGLLGYAAPDSQPFSTSLYAYLVMDDGYTEYAGPDALRQATAAHEYNHVLQFNYDAIQDIWMFESTAVWAEEKVYDSVNDYRGYLPYWAACTEVPLTADDPSGCELKKYGSGIWNIWLDERYGADVIRSAWSGSNVTSPPHFAPAAYDAAIAGPGDGFFDAFTRFAAAMAEWRAPNGDGLSEGSAFSSDVERVATLSDGSSRLLELDHTTFALLNVPVPTGGQPELHLSGSLPSGSAGAIALVARTGTTPGAGTVATRLAPLPNGGSATVTLGSPGGYGRITAVIVNAGVGQDGWGEDDWDWTMDDLPVGLALSTAAPPSPPNVELPDTSITAAPSGTTTSGGATFEFGSTSAGARFECSLDGSAPAACTSPRSYQGIGYGRHTFSVTAIDQLGRRDRSPAVYSWTVEAAAPAPAADVTAPRIEQIALAPATFRAARRGASIAAAGTRVAYGLSESASVTFGVDALKRGRRVRRKCVRPRRKHRRRRVCTRVRPVGAFEHAGRNGLNQIRFTGRVAGKRLRPGRYRLTLVATDAAGNTSAPRRATFKVKR